MRKLRTLVLLATVVAVAGLSGCMPLSMGIFTPIPVPPWVTERMQEKYCHKNDWRTPILPPIKEGAPPPHGGGRYRRPPGRAGTPESPRRRR